MAIHKVMVTVSYGDGDKAKPTRSVHIVSVEDAGLEEEEFAEALSSIVIGLIQAITVPGLNEEAKPAFGIYKVEYPLEGTTEGQENSHVH